MPSKFVDPASLPTMTFDWGVIKPLVATDNTENPEVVWQLFTQDVRSERAQRTEPGVARRGQRDDGRSTEGESHRGIDRDRRRIRDDRDGGRSLRAQRGGNEAEEEHGCRESNRHRRTLRHGVHG